MHDRITFSFGDQRLRILEGPEYVSLVEYGETINIPYEDLDAAIAVLTVIAGRHKPE